MKYVPRLGPFINEEGDVWVPASIGGIVVARRKASEASFSNHLRFVGMEDARMTLHESTWHHTDGLDGDGDEDAAIEACEETTKEGPCSWTGRAYHFREDD